MKGSVRSVRDDSDIAGYPRVLSYQHEGFARRTVAGSESPIIIALSFADGLVQCVPPGLSGAV